MQYGYLELSDMETEQQRTVVEVEYAVKELQRRAGLRETGVFDSETRRLIQTPRCGVQDKSAGDSSVQASAVRSSAPESFTLNNAQWPLTDITYKYDT